MKGKTIPEVLISTFEVHQPPLKTLFLTPSLISTLWFTEPSLLIISKNFDPCVYLLKVQQDATFKQLEQGVDKLKVGIQQRNDVMKNLVKTHFAKFVSAKSTIDCELRIGIIINDIPLTTSSH